MDFLTPDLTLDALPCMGNKARHVRTKQSRPAQVRVRCSCPSTREDCRTLAAYRPADFHKQVLFGAGEACEMHDFH